MSSSTTFGIERLNDTLKCQAGEFYSCFKADNNCDSFNCACAPCPNPRFCLAKGQCSEGRAGVGCTDCAAAFMSLADSCVRCPSQKGLTVIPLLALAGCGLLILHSFCNGVEQAVRARRRRLVDDGATDVSADAALPDSERVTAVGLQQLRAYYQKHDPAKADHDIVDIFDKWGAAELEKGLQRRYGESLEEFAAWSHRSTALNKAASLLSLAVFLQQFDRVLSLRVPWPAAVRQAHAAVAPLVLFDIAGAATPTCAGAGTSFEKRWLLGQLLPVGPLFAVMLMIWYKQWKYRLPERQDWAEGSEADQDALGRESAVQAWQAKVEEARKMAEDILSGDTGADVRLRKLYNGAIGCVLLMFTAMAKTIVVPFDCMPTIDGVSVMRHDPEVRCRLDQCSSTADRKFYNVWLLGGCVALTICVGLIAVPARMVRRGQRDGKLDSDERFMHRFGALYMRYDSRHPCWEVVILTRRLLLELISAVFSRVPVAQLVLCALLFSTALWSQQQHQPYISDALNRIERDLLHACLALTALGLLAYVGTPAEAVLFFSFLFLVGNVARIVPQLRRIWWEADYESKPQEKVEIGSAERAMKGMFQMTNPLFNASTNADDGASANTKTGTGVRANCDAGPTSADVANARRSLADARHGIKPILDEDRTVKPDAMRTNPLFNTNAQKPTALGIAAAQQRLGGAVVQMPVVQVPIVQAPVVQVPMLAEAAGAWDFSGPWQATCVVCGNSDASVHLHCRCCSVAVCDSEQCLMGVDAQHSDKPGGYSMCTAPGESHESFVCPVCFDKHGRLSMMGIDVDMDADADVHGNAGSGDKSKTGGEGMEALKARAHRISSTTQGARTSDHHSGGDLWIHATCRKCGAPLDPLIKTHCTSCGTSLGDEPSFWFYLFLFLTCGWCTDRSDRICTAGGVGKFLSHTVFWPLIAIWRCLTYCCGDRHLSDDEGGVSKEAREWARQRARAVMEAAADRDEVQQIAARSVAKLTKSGDIRMENMTATLHGHML